MHNLSTEALKPLPGQVGRVRGGIVVQQDEAFLQPTLSFSTDGLLELEDLEDHHAIPVTINELKQRIISALDNVTGDICHSVFGKNLTTDMTCAVSQEAHILNTCEIGHRINKSLKFCFKFE